MVKCERCGAVNRGYKGPDEKGDYFFDCGCPIPRETPAAREVMAALGASRVNESAPAARAEKNGGTSFGGVTMPEMQPVESSTIREIGFDEASEKLLVRFKDGGLYTYSDVPKEVYEEMLSARSVGRYFHQNVRLQFSCEGPMKEGFN